MRLMIWKFPGLIFTRANHDEGGAPARMRPLVIRRYCARPFRLPVVWPAGS